MKFLIKNPPSFAFEREASMLSNEDQETMVCEPNLACFLLGL